MAEFDNDQNENDNVDTDENLNDDAANAGGADDDSNDDAGQEPVTFASKAEYVKAVNKIVTSRLKRNEQKYAPIVAERDTLKKRVDELSGAEKGKTAAEQQIESLSKQVTDLLTYQQTTQRNELVREIAKDQGLPEEFIPRVQGDDPDSITEDVEKLVELLNVGKPAKKVTVPPTTKPAGKDGKGGKGSDGKGGEDDDNKTDPAALAKKVGRYGHRPVFVG